MSKEALKVVWLAQKPLDEAAFLLQKQGVAVCLEKDFTAVALLRYCISVYKIELNQDFKVFCFKYYENNTTFYNFISESQNLLINQGLTDACEL